MKALNISIAIILWAIGSLLVSLNNPFLAVVGIAAFILSSNSVVYVVRHSPALLKFMNEE